MNFPKCLLLSLILLLSACLPLKPEQPTNPSGDNHANLQRSEWLLESFGEVDSEKPVIDGSSITLAFAENGQVGGYSGCNSYGGAYTIQSRKLNFGEITGTLMACEDEAVTVQEQEYLSALRTASRFAVANDRLTIWYEKDSHRLNFVRAPVSAPDPSLTTTPEPTAGAVDGKDEGARIEFPAGQTSAEVFAELAAGMTDSYVVRGQQGQTLTVEIISPANDVLLSVVGEDGTPLKRYQNGPPSWTGELLITQDYILQAVSVGQASSYTLRVSVEPHAARDRERVVFEPGTTYTVTFSIQ